MENGGAPAPTSATAGGIPAAAAPSDLSGKTLGDFRLQRRIGQGGMGQVYLAEQVSLKRPVALKIMKTELAASPTALLRFQAEAEAVARVTHANIVQIFAIGQVDGLHYIALEYVEGRNLRDFLSRKGPPELPLALSIMIQVASALQRASELGIVHRDIKPENILLTKQGEAKVADFGLSRCFAQDREPLNLTQSGVSLGTPLYMAPEQVQGKEIDPRTDIYSLGVTCYHMLAGEPPFRGANAFDVAVQHVQNEPPPLAKFRPDLPAELCGVVHKMMAKKPEERYPSSRDLLADLTRLRDKLGIMAEAHVALFQTGLDSATRLAPPPVAPAHGRRGLLAGAVLVSLLLALGLGVGLRAMRGRPAPPADEPLANGASPTPSAAQRHEQELIEAIRKPFNARDLDQSKKHLELAVQLGLIYLDQRRLKDAEAYFKDLRDKPPHEQKIYQALGRIGLAVILAFQDQAKESNLLFADLEKAKPPFTDKFRPWDPKSPFRWRMTQDYPEFFLFNVPDVRRVVAEALDYNAVNLGLETLPEPLERLRKPPALGGKPGSN